jgi:MinD-like ATPase involved in chromosome partitioning or flagellar assembly
MILTIPEHKHASYLDWVIRADETVLVVSPDHLQGGYDYVEAVFGRFTTIVKRQWTSCSETRIEPRALEFSVICAQIADLLQGFKLFDQIQKTIQDELNMREAGVDMILRYLGGILEDRRNLQEAERLDLPLTILKPHSPASQCMNHIAHSLLKPTHARDPRICLRKASGSRFLAWCRRQKNPVAKASGD